MKSQYFQLQYKLITRQINDLGIPLFIGYLILIMLFITSYKVLNQYPKLGVYAVFLSNFQLLFLVADQQRTEFLQNIYTKIDFQYIRLLENGCITLPFISLLIIHQSWLLCFLSFSCIVAFAYLRIPTFGTSIPSPFSKFPFEFTIGFRRNYMLIFLVYILAGIGIYVNNSNLVLFCIACIIVIATFFYQYAEPISYLWNYNCSATIFLLRKMRRAIFQILLLTAPILIAYTLSFPENIMHILLLLFGMLFMLAFVICLKYAAFPRAINIPEGFILALCFLFYPLIIALIPYYYSKAIQNLKLYL